TARNTRAHGAAIRSIALLFGVVCFDAVAFEVGEQLAEMLAIARFDRANNVHRRDVRAGKSAVVHYLFDTYAGGSDLCCQIGQTARSIANHGVESAKPAVRDETAFDYATENVGIYVAAAK